jgi:hypothetical protein
MNLITSPIEDVINFTEKFLSEKDLDRTSFDVKHSFYGKTEMPFKVIQNALTDKRQSEIFLRESAQAISLLDFNNVSKEEFRKFFQILADQLIECV